MCDYIQVGSKARKAKFEMKRSERFHFYIEKSHLEYGRSKTLDIFPDHFYWYQNNIMRHLSFSLEAGVLPKFISKDVIPTNTLSRLSRKPQPYLLYFSQHRLKTKGKITIHIRVGDLHTWERSTVVGN